MGFIGHNETSLLEVNFSEHSCIQAEQNLQKVTDNSLAKQIRALKLSLVQRDHRKMKDFLFSTHFPNSSALKINKFFSKLDGSATYTWV